MRTWKILLKRRKGPIVGLFFLTVVLTFAISFWSVINGSIPFWFDPARDLLLALDNLKKLTLIGPPTGIPGVFYGPYWIWFISLAMLISRDPRIITLMTLTIPYFVFFPLILLRFSRWIGIGVSLSIWLFFILTNEQYTTFLWNPHWTSLLFLLLTYFLLTWDLQKLPKGKLFRLTAVGICTGLILNIHMSFGLAVFISTALFLVIEVFVRILKTKRDTFIHIACVQIALLLSFIAGVGIIFIPFGIFELRHGFGQTQAFIQATINSAIYNSASVGQTGLKSGQIIYTFFSIPASFLRVHVLFAVTIMGMVIIIFFWQWMKKGYRNSFLGKGIGYLLLTISVILTLYLTSRNPVYQYHFVGVEIVVLLLFGFIVSQSRFITRIVFVWVVVVIGIYLLSYAKTFSVDLLSISSLGTKRHIAETITRDAGGPFVVYAYSPAIYTYDYDYLFQWLGGGNYRSEDTKKKIPSAYLIIPRTSQAIHDDFIHYKSPDEYYKTIKTWKFPDNTEVIKRELKVTSVSPI